MRAFPRPSPSATGLVLAVLSVPVSAAGSCGLSAEIQQQVDASLRAPGQVAYSGTLLLEQNLQRQFLAVDSTAGGARAQLRRLSEQADPPLEYLSAAHEQLADACALARYYELSLESGSVIAGRATRRITARPRDSLRFGYIMDVDLETALPLRMITATQEGKVLERYEFADIRLTDATSPEPDAIAARATGSHYRVAALPPGFNLVHHHDDPVETLVISDGLAAASVFVETPAQPLRPGEGAVLRGSTLSYSRGMNGPSGSVLITVIGEVPLQTARLLADAVRPFDVQSAERTSDAD